MTTTDPRAELERLVRERRDDYANLSRLIGRNPAYIQQFIKRGVPRKLDEADRGKLACYFNVSEVSLGASSEVARGGGNDHALIPIPRLEVRASAGAGSLAGDERPASHIGFEETWLRQLAGGRLPNLSVIGVQGDSMSPTLSDGDDILVNTSDGLDRLRDGIYVLRCDDTLLVKRVGLGPSPRRVAIKSDNGAYPDWPDCAVKDIDIIGRVVWAGRRLS